MSFKEEVARFLERKGFSGVEYKNTLHSLDGGGASYYFKATDKEDDNFYCTVAVKETPEEHEPYSFKVVDVQRKRYDY